MQRQCEMAEKMSWVVSRGHSRDGVSALVCLALAVCRARVVAASFLVLEGVIVRCSWLKVNPGIENLLEEDGKQKEFGD